MGPQVIEPKRGVNVGRVVVDMRIENAEDLSQVARGALAADQVRNIDVQALVDTGATLVALPSSDVARLGLRPVRQKQARTAAGVVTQQFFSAVRLTVQGRDCLVEAADLPDGSPALLGQVPLELLDFWVDTTNQRLVGNPEHGGQWMVDQF
jgi:predicted aspartyl protease